MQKTLDTQQYRSPLTRLRQARLKAGLKQEQLAVMLEASQEQISKCETGLRRLDVIEQKPWIEALGLQLPSVLEMLDQQSIG